MVETICQPLRDAHVAACGLFCTNCGAFKKEKCQGCMIKPWYGSCKVRACCVTKGIQSCAACDEFKAPRDYRECPKVHNFIAKMFGLMFGSNKTAALVMLRDQGLEAFLADRRQSGKM